MLEKLCNIKENKLLIILIIDGYKIMPDFCDKNNTGKNFKHGWHKHRLHILQ